MRKITEYEEEKGEDRISTFLEPLLLEILSRIPIKDLARTCILSKRWNYIWKTFPFLNFDKEFYFSLQGNNKTSSAAETHWKNALLMKKAKQMVLSRCQEENPNLLKLHWVIPEDKSWEYSSLQFIPNLAKTGLRELSVLNNYQSPSKEYLKLPHSPLILPDSIEKLYFYRLEGFKSLSPYSTVKFKHLSTIELDDVVMVDGGIILNGLNLVCPSLESLKILNCSGLENLYLTGLPKLKRIVLMRSSLKTLKIESLEKMEILSLQFNNNLSQVDITNTNIDSLRELELHGNFLTQDLFNEFVCKCRFLQILDIGNTENLKTINISMDKIEIIAIKYVKKLVKIKMIAPMLEEFQFSTIIYSDPPTVLWNFPNSETFVDISIFTVSYDDWIHYIPNDDKLEIWQDFFGNFSHAKDLLVVSCPPQFLNWVKSKGSISPFGCLKNIVYNNEISEYPLPPILHLLESLIFLAPQATTMSFVNNTSIEYNVSFENNGMTISVNDNPVDNIILILKIQYDEKECRETTISSEFNGIEAWLLSALKIAVQKYHGRERDWDELIKFVSKFKNLEFVLPKEKENLIFVD